MVQVSFYGIKTIAVTLLPVLAAVPIRMSGCPSFYGKPPRRLPMQTRYDLYPYPHSLRDDELSRADAQGYCRLLPFHHRIFSRPIVYFPIRGRSLNYLHLSCVPFPSDFN